MRTPDVKALEAHPTLTTHPLLGVAGTVLTPVMIALVHFGIPSQQLPKPQPGHPTPNWRGFLYASLGAAPLYTALDQGQRLDWFQSSLIIGLVAAGALLILAATVRHFLLPNPLVNYQFLMRRNTLLLAPVLISFRFIMLATVVSIPSFLGSVRGFLPLQEAPVLAWVGLQVRQQAFTLAISDSFLLLAACYVGCLLLVAFMSTVPTQYRQVAAAPVEAK
jgi:hypothetical protein